MQNPELVITFDTESDVLYLRRTGYELRSSNPLPSDAFIIVNRDLAGEVVGLQVLYASDLPRVWAEHPDRHLLPPEFTRTLDTWVPPAQDQ